MDIGKTTALPLFRNFFVAGRTRSVVTARAGWPLKDLRQPYGGNMKVVGRADHHSRRREMADLGPDSWFYDIGNVFSTGNRYSFTGIDGVTPVEYEFKYDRLKHSAGLAVQWLALPRHLPVQLRIPLNACPRRSVLFRGRGRAVPVLRRPGVLRRGPVRGDSFQIGVIQREFGRSDDGSRAGRDAAAAGSPGDARAELKIGVLDYGRLMDESPQARRCSRRLRNEAGAKQRELQTAATTCRGGTS